MRILKILLMILGAVAAMGSVGGAWYVKSRGFSAREKPGALETWLARQARRMATPPGARNLRNPVEPTMLAVAEARDHFADHCAICHANDGGGKTAINEGLY